MQPVPTTPFTLLAAMLAPLPTPQRRQQLENLCKDPETDWGRLLYIANQHLCTPLWTVRMRQHGLLRHLPQELQTYLDCLHQENRERNRLLREGLDEITATLDRNRIPSVLLKGAATFCDDLYNDPGARVMGDLDILIPDEAIEPARQLLEQRGYCESFDPEHPEPVHPVDDRHHHIERLFKPGTPVVVELHFTVGGGQAGRMLPAETAWQHTRSHQERDILNPTQRLIHNTAHALLPGREFLRSHLPLQQLAEFAALATRYRNRIDWPQWLKAGDSQHAATPFLTWLLLAHQLMELPWPELPPATHRHRWHVKRLLRQGERDGILTPAETDPEARNTTLTTKVYFHLNQPLWIWRNIHYSPGPMGLLRRLGYYTKKVITGVNWRQFRP